MNLQSLVSGSRKPIAPATDRAAAVAAASDADAKLATLRERVATAERELFGVPDTEGRRERRQLDEDRGDVPQLERAARDAWAVVYRHDAELAAAACREELPAIVADAAAVLAALDVIDGALRRRERLAEAPFESASLPWPVPADFGLSTDPTGEMFRVRQECQRIIAGRLN
jgi:hypothetical protein